MTLYLVVVGATARALLLSRRHGQVFGIGGEGIAHLAPAATWDVDTIAPSRRQHLTIIKQCQQMVILSPVIMMCIAFSQHDIPKLL